MVLTEQKTKRSIYLLETKSEIEAVLFDMDGVLANTVPAHILAWNAALSKNNLPVLDRSTYILGLGRSNLDMLDKILDLYHKTLQLSTRKDMIDNKERIFREIIKTQISTTPGVIDWLEFFKEKQIRCSVASSGEMANISVVLETLHISDYFTSIISGAHLPATKPDPLIFQLAAASLGVGPEKCMVIEDAPAGIQAAKSAHMLCCAIATTLPLDKLMQADILLEDLSQVLPESIFTD